MTWVELEGEKKKKNAEEDRDLGSRDPHDLFLSLSDLIISLSLIWSPSL